MKTYWLAKTRDDQGIDYALFYVEWNDGSMLPPDEGIIKWCLDKGIYRPQTTVLFERLSEDVSDNFPINRMILSTNMNFWFIRLLNPNDEK